MNKKPLIVLTLALLTAAFMVGCRRAKPAVVSEVETVATATLAAGAGRTVVPVFSPTPTSQATPTTTLTPSTEPATATPITATEIPPTPAPTPTPIPTSTPTTAPIIVPTAAPTAEVSGPRIHVVQPGENLFRIALHYGMTWKALAAANGIVNPDLIYAGQRLIIPAEVSAIPTEPEKKIHVVQPGDNLFRIALKYGTTVEAIAIANDISNVNLIYPGQRLVIP